MAPEGLTWANLVNTSVTINYSLSAVIKIRINYIQSRFIAELTVEFRAMWCAVLSRDEICLHVFDVVVKCRLVVCFIGTYDSLEKTNGIDEICLFACSVMFVC